MLFSSCSRRCDSPQRRTTFSRFVTLSSGPRRWRSVAMVPRLNVALSYVFSTVSIQNTTAEKLDRGHTWLAGEVEVTKGCSLYRIFTYSIEREALRWNVTISTENSCCNFSQRHGGGRREVEDWSKFLQVVISFFNPITSAIFKFFAYA